MLKIEKHEELIALMKALKHVKFECKEYEARYLAASPLIADLYKKVYSSLIPYYKSIGVSVMEDWQDIATLPNYISVIKEHIKNTDSWNQLPEESKSEFVIDLIRPFSYNDLIIKDLIEFGNSIH